jgi:hypothetical protein
MPNTPTSARTGALSSLLRPIQKIIQKLLPDFIEKPLKKPAVRAELVQAADAMLVKQFPVARLVPKDARQRLIRKQLDLVIDEVLLNDDLHPKPEGARAKPKKTVPPGKRASRATPAARPRPVPPGDR